jgi:mannose-6-phosphate isomerase-like protein (cupin superfamily)
MSGRASIVRNGEGPTFAVGPTLITSLVDSRVTDQVFVAEHRLPGGFEGPPPHRHRDMLHVFYVLEGQVQFSAGDEQLLGEPGDTVFVPNGVAHRFGNNLAELARMLEFNLPGGFDSYYAELETAFPAGAPVVPAKVQEIMSRHDIEPA